jgi:hypothetical protein
MSAFAALWVQDLTSGKRPRACDPALPFDLADDQRVRRLGRHLGQQPRTRTNWQSRFLSNPTLFRAMATFMFGAIISGEVGIAEQSATGGKIGIVESAA